MRYNRTMREDMEELCSRNIPLDLLRGKKLLITGANGMLATYLIYFLMYLNDKKEMGIKIIALTRNEKKANDRFNHFLGRENFKLLFQDVCDEIVLDERKIDYIVHAAGNASPKYILQDPVGIIRANTLGTMNVLECARNYGKPKVLYTSTREIYGTMSKEIMNIKENQYGALSPTELRACYPESKRLSETLLESYRFQYGVEYMTVRIAHSYGPGMAIDEDGRVMADFISDIVQKRDIVIKSDGTTERSFCYVEDAIAGMLIALLKGNVSEAYNIANEKEPKSIKEVAEILIDLFPECNSVVKLEIPKKTSAGYSKLGRTKLNVEKLESLGWQCQIPLCEGLRRTVLSFWE